ncbi:hypothetical protein GCM10011575_21990 [Microlunatus endophyticus]|uniref:Glycosyl hydrolase family 65, N-terminal domain n=1 Tax=Microlunatus endophyticus TaxID=1716077 RepID=A0A917S907_9ACTN|nr:hypothetical protein [Microlunatus endophyticus]GGL63102.1 hypothetical protein GCM10011575_21990 [Microlunatus endophyticus]
MSGAGIDRREVVGRHRVVQRSLDPRSPVSVGNGEFAFTADLTGLQSFPELYPVAPQKDHDRPGTLLGTYAQWGWHVEPAHPLPSLADSLRHYDSPHGPVDYVDLSAAVERGEGQGAEWLRGNPHRLHLGLLGFADHRGSTPRPLELADLRWDVQELDLWSGRLHSSFTWCGTPVRVETICDPELDRLAVTIDSQALTSGLVLRLRFPYGSQQWHDGADWARPDDHTTILRERGRSRWQLERRLDETRYGVIIASAEGTTVHGGVRHEVIINAVAPHAELVIDFSRDASADEGNHDARPATEEVSSRSAAAWGSFWSSGAALDLGAAGAEQAAEVERRVVLSQYLTKINCSGSTPPAETGLVCNSWAGKFHLEMTWWHTSHFALWGRPELLRPTLDWFADALPAATDIALAQGLPGARWPKHIGPDARESPSNIGPFLIWQQPHPIYLAELLYRAVRGREILEQFAEMIFATAAFMAGYAAADNGSYRLGPPLIPAQETYADLKDRVVDPTFELAYWGWALTAANAWRRRLGLPDEPLWSEVAQKLARPTVRSGTYAAIGCEPWTVRTDHPSMLCALGMLPMTPLVDRGIMSATLDDVLSDWDWETTWGWDYPVLAMCATRLGRPEQAVDALLAPRAKNTYLTNGHNRQTPSLPLYLPGNGGVLSAVALMAGGWAGAPDVPTPGFPRRWGVRAEGFVPAP